MIQIRVDQLATAIAAGKFNVSYFTGATWNQPPYGVLGTLPPYQLPDDTSAALMAELLGGKVIHLTPPICWVPFTAPNTGANTNPSRLAPFVQFSDNSIISVNSVTNLWLWGGTPSIGNLTLSQSVELQLFCSIPQAVLSPATLAAVSRDAVAQQAMSSCLPWGPLEPLLYTLPAGVTA
jgi:hypothetical protein